MKKNWLCATAFIVLGFSFYVSLLVLACGCANSPARIAAEYQKEQLECIERAKSIESSQECRNKVKAKFGRSVPDAGVD
jgi:hypothetical protein